MAKFKVGDKVKVKGAGVETIKAVYPKGKGSGLDSTQVDMSVDWYETDGGGMIADEDIVGVANSRACNSTNPVVANAMAARGGVARNAETSSANDIKVADFLQKAKSRIGAEINTLADTVKLASRYKLSDKGKSDLAALKNILTKLTSAGLHL